VLRRARLPYNVAPPATTRHPGGTRPACRPTGLHDRSATLGGEPPAGFCFAAGGRLSYALLDESRKRRRRPPQSRRQQNASGSGMVMECCLTSVL
jgi:hypothetical protein